MGDPMQKQSLLILTAAVATMACADTLPNPTPDSFAEVLNVAGRTEFKGDTVKNIGPGFWLRAVESVDIPSRYANNIIEYYPYGGSARLPSGRCIKFVRGQQSENEPPDRGSIGAKVYLDPSLCVNLPPQGNPLQASRCNGVGEPSFVGGWRLTCSHLPEGRSALVAVGQSPATKGREVTLAVLDQKVWFFDAFVIHPPNAEVTTLGIRPDGKSIISKYFWFAGETGK